MPVAVATDGAKWIAVAILLAALGGRRGRPVAAEGLSALWRWFRRR